MQILADSSLHQAKESLYLSVRMAEGRVLSDDELLLLPGTRNSAFKEEWALRSASLDRLLKYLNKRTGKPLRILDIGCGNGWMSHKLSQAGHYVTAMDLNMDELTQAERVFGSSEKLEWVYGNVLEPLFDGQNFNVVLFAASCQYFPNIALLTKAVAPLLRPGGAIHLFDSIFYLNKDITAARKRSQEYYSKLGFPEMSNYYFHHSSEALKQLGYRKRYPPFYKASKLQWWIKSADH